MAWFRKWDRGTAHRVDRFVANSRAIADRIQSFYGRSAQVIHPPVRTDFFTHGAERGEEFLIQLLDTDDGARRLGELGIGTNYKIDRGTRDVLLDEKIGGTVHMAVGASYPESGGTNESAVHTDLVCDLRQGGRIEVDGEVIQKDGKFTV